MGLEDFMKTFVPLVERYIDRVLRVDISTLERSSRHLIEAGGKRLRPLMLGLFTRAYGGDLDLAALAGASIEILHNFTLVHDDIMDRDEMRRGVPTTHIVYGEPMAILAGDYLYAKSYRALLMLRDRVEERRLVRMLDLLTWASETVAEGQALDLTLPPFSEVSEDSYIEMIYKKTSSLFMAAAGIGVLLGGSSDDDVERAMDYARYAGIAFQVRDDILGLLGDPSVTGKPVLNDLREGKRTVLVIHAFRNADEEERREMLRVVGNRNSSTEDLVRVREIIVKRGGVKRAEELVKTYTERALEKLREIRERAVDRDAVDMIEELTLRLAYREK